MVATNNLSFVFFFQGFYGMSKQRLNPCFFPSTGYLKSATKRG